MREELFGDIDDFCFRRSFRFTCCPLPKLQPSELLWSFFFFDEPIANHRYKTYKTAKYLVSASDSMEMESNPSGGAKFGKSAAL